MTWNPGPMKFWEGVYEHPKDFFDPNDEALSQAQYFIEHPEIQALASLFIAHMSREPVKDKDVLKAAGYFFTRPADVLQAEVDEVLRKTDKLGPKEEMRKKYYRMNPIPRPGSAPECACPSLQTPSIEFYYSTFISKSTSASTLPSIPSKEEVAPTLEQLLWEMVNKALNNALNNMYVAREHELHYDEAYLCIMTCVQRAVESVWVPRVHEIYEIIETLIDDVRRISRERRNLQLMMTNKLPIKVNRLKNDFKGYAEVDDYPELKKKEILETLETRKWRYNRYPKDVFGVYLSTADRNLDTSSTYPPRACEEESSERSTDAITLYYDFDEDDD